MKKLLHERLRDAEKSSSRNCCEALPKMIGTTCDHFDYCYDCIESVISSLADEIEKYYIPRPRFEDADGAASQLSDVCPSLRYSVEIKVGDTVWHVNGRHPFEVCEITDQGIEIEDKLSVADGCCVVEPSSLTHREPDSLQRVQQLASDWAHDDNLSNSSAADFRDVMEEIANRLTAIMERDA